MSEVHSDQLKQALSRAIEYHRAGELELAEQAYEEVLKIDSEQPDALHLSGVIAHRLGDSEIAKARIFKSLAIEPKQVNAWNNLGNVYAELSQWPLAIEAYEKALAFNPEYTMAYMNLGDVYLTQERYAESVSYYRQAIAVSADSDAYFKLAYICEKMADFKSAVDNYCEAISRNNESVAPYRRLAKLLRELERFDEAEAVYESWLKIDPDSAIAKHFLAVCRGENLSRASSEYINQLFNEDFAVKFDNSLKALDYRAPELIAQAIRNHRLAIPRDKLHIADLGCGTGLCAPLLRDVADYLVGVDLSQAMLEIAKRSRLYDELKQMDLIAFLRANSNAFDILVSADTFVYLGDLRPVFAAAVSAIRKDGVFAFSVEYADDATVTEFALSRSGRYVHNRSYIENQLSASGLRTLALNRATIRMEGGEPVAGIIAVAGK